MDSKTIYIISETYLPKVNWEKYNGEEWIYVGVDQDFNEEKVSHLIRSTFDVEEVYVVTDRHGSGRLLITDVIRTVKERLQERKYILWNLSFDLVLEFAPVGVARKGKKG